MNNYMMYRLKGLLVILALQTQYVSCDNDCKSPQIVHMDFCDFLNDVPSKWDKEHSDKILQDKWDHFLIDNRSVACLSPLILGDFIKKDEFAQREIHNGYYRLSFTFYKKSSRTDALLKGRSSRYLDFCSDDIYVEYEWTEGKPTDTLYYQNGVIKGAEKIQIEEVPDSLK